MTSPIKVGVAIMLLGVVATTLAEPTTDHKVGEIARAHHGVWLSQGVFKGTPMEGL